MGARHRAAAQMRADMRVALIGETLADARAVMVEGVSGLLAVHPPDAKPLYEPSKRQVTWPNGAIAQLFSADDPESLRGPQFSAAWCDELCKWRRPDETWDMLQFGLRLGAQPAPGGDHDAAADETAQGAARRSAHRGDAGVDFGQRSQSRAGFLEAIVGRYRGTRLGRQELDAELLEDRADALWPRDLIERAACASRRDAARGGGGRSAGVERAAAPMLAASSLSGLATTGGPMCSPTGRASGASPLDWAGAAIAPIGASRRTASWPRSTKAASWSRR